MGHSIFKPLQIQCPNCNQPLNANCWLIVDTVEHLDLMEEVISGTIHNFDCAECGREIIVSAPLLVHDPLRHQVFFIAEVGATEEQRKQEVKFLIMKLAKTFEGAAPDYLRQVNFVNRKQLAETLILEILAGLPPKDREKLMEEVKGASSPEERMEALRPHFQVLARLENAYVGANDGTDLPDEVYHIISEIQECTGISEISRRVALCRKALALVNRRQDPSLWASLNVEMGNCLIQNPRDDRVENIELAIGLYEKALEVETRDALPFDWAQTTHNLALAYADRVLGNRAENLEKAIGLYEKALEVKTRDAVPFDWAQITNNLASAYAARVCGDRAENLEKAIRLYEKALEVRARDAAPFDWAQTTHNLAVVYADRILGNRAENLEKAIGLYEKALEVNTRDAAPLEWAQITNNLAVAYASRVRGDRAENFEKAIGLYEKALEVRTRDAEPFKWADTTTNLALTYASRVLGNRAENLEKAIGFYEKALEVKTRDAEPLEWAQTANNLAVAYVDRVLGNRTENLEKAIRLYEKALEVRARDTAPFDWAQTTHNLAVAYADRVLGNRAENLEKAIGLYEKALEVRTRDALPFYWAQTTHNLAGAYASRVRGDRAENLEKAIGLYEKALEVNTRDALPKDHRSTQRNLGSICMIVERWTDGAEAFLNALAAGDFLYKASATPEARHAELSEVENLPARAAYCLAKSGGDLRLAVLALDRNRARWLSEILASKGERPANVPEAGWQAFLKIRKMIGNLETELRLPYDIPGRRDFIAVSQELGTARENLEAAISVIRKHDPTFMPDPTFDDILEAFRPGHPLVYFAVTPAGSTAFIVHGQSHEKASDPVTVVWLDEAEENGLEELVQSYFGAYDRWFSEPKNEEARAEWHNTIAETTSWIGGHLMKTVADELKRLGFSRAVLVPQGRLGLLPLHAAWISKENKVRRRYLMDEIAFTYAPNAAALAAASKAARSTAADRLLAVDSPYVENASPLPNSSAEVAAISAHFPRRKIFADEDATIEAMINELPGSNVLHFSCHGMAGFAEPLKGGLLMANDQMLTLAEILTLNLDDAHIAVLSACETGILGTNLPDEVIGLPTGMIRAGVPGVVASLWSVSDLSTMMLMTRFYDLWREEGFEPPEALRRAQIWIRDTSNGEKAAYFRSFLPEHDSLKMPVHVADMLYKESMLTRPDENDFEHPFHWAGFAYTGV